MKFLKAKLMVAGLVLAAVCVIAPQQLKAEVPAAQMDGVMGQSMEDETVYEETPNLDALIMKGAVSNYSLPATQATTRSSYSQDFLDNSFTTAGDYTSATYYHRIDYEDYQLINGIDVSWWQTKDKKNTALNWEKVHDAGIDFAFVRVGSRDTSDGSIYEDTAADSHIQAALENDINIGLYIFSQALTEKEAREEAKFVLKQIDKYDWDVTLPIVIDREKGSHPKPRRQLSARLLQTRLQRRDIRRVYMHHMHGSNLISILIRSINVGFGLLVIIIQRLAIPRVEVRMKMYYMIMIFGSILQFPESVGMQEIWMQISGTKIQQSRQLD